MTSICTTWLSYTRLGRAVIYLILKYRPFSIFHYYHFECRSFSIIHYIIILVWFISETFTSSIWCSNGLWIRLHNTLPLVLYQYYDKRYKSILYFHFLDLLAAPADDVPPNFKFEPMDNLIYKFYNCKLYCAVPVF